MYVETKQIEPTQLNYRRCKGLVHDGTIKQGGIFASNYVVYKVEIIVQNSDLFWEIGRKDADFAFLRKTLLRHFP